MNNFTYLFENDYKLSENIRFFISDKWKECRSKNDQTNTKRKSRRMQPRVSDVLSEGRSKVFQISVHMNSNEIQGSKNYYLFFKGFLCLPGGVKKDCLFV